MKKNKTRTRNKKEPLWVKLFFSFFRYFWIILLLVSILIVYKAVGWTRYRIACSCSDGYLEDSIKFNGTKYILCSNPKGIKTLDTLIDGVKLIEKREYSLYECYRYGRRLMENVT